jgi:hypothetical protein
MTQESIAEFLTDDAEELYEMELLDEVVTIKGDMISPEIAQKFVDKLYDLKDMDISEEDEVSERYYVSLEFIQKIIS